MHTMCPSMVALPMRGTSSKEGRENNCSGWRQVSFPTGIWSKVVALHISLTCAFQGSNTDVPDIPSRILDVRWPKSGRATVGRYGVCWLKTMLPLYIAFTEKLPSTLPQPRIFPEGVWTDMAWWWWEEFRGCESCREKEKLTPASKVNIIFPLSNPSQPWSMGVVS